MLCTILVLSSLFILFSTGKAGWAAPRLKDAALSLDKLREGYVEVCQITMAALGWSGNGQVRKSNVFGCNKVYEYILILLLIIHLPFSSPTKLSLYMSYHVYIARTSFLVNFLHVIQLGFFNIRSYLGDYVLKSLSLSRLI